MTPAILQDLGKLFGQDSAHLASPFDASAIAGKLALSLGFGIAVALTHSLTRRKHSPEGSSFATTLVLLAVLVAMTTIVIDNSVARAFSLVGALAIVRFRTSVEDTRDTVFVIFAVVVGMAIGAGNTTVCYVGVPIVVATALAAALLTRAPAVASTVGIELGLLVRLGAGHDPEKTLIPLLREHAGEVRLAGILTARQGSAIDLRYRVRLRLPERPIEFVTALNRVEGVQQVELGDGR